MSKRAGQSGRVIVPLIVLLAMAALITLSVRNWKIQQHAGEDLLIISGTVEARFTRIASLSGGRLQNLVVQEGQLIKSGDPVAGMDPVDLPQKLEQAQQAIVEAEAQRALLEAGATGEELAAAQHRSLALQSVVANLEQGSRIEDIAAARASVQIASTQLSDAKDEVSRLQLLFDNGVVEERRIVAARAQVAALEDSLEIARQNLERLEQGPRAEEIEQARQQAAAANSDYERIRRGARTEELLAANARLAQMQASHSGLERIMQEVVVLAPADGEIVSVPVTQGDMLSPGQTICELLLPDSLYIQSFVPENRLSWISIGSSLEYAIDGLSGRHQATVSFISPVAEFTPRNLQTTEKRMEQVFRIKLIPETGATLRPGEICDIWIPAPQATYNAAD
jgi:multidrug resistance efflux pump